LSINPGFAKGQGNSIYSPGLEKHQNIEEFLTTEAHQGAQRMHEAALYSLRKSCCPVREAPHCLIENVTQMAYLVVSQTLRNELILAVCWASRINCIKIHEV
jgi:hypothetical protein